MLAFVVCLSHPSNNTPSRFLTHPLRAKRVKPTKRIACVGRSVASAAVVAADMNDVMYKKYTTFYNGPDLFETVLIKPPFLTRFQFVRYINLVDTGFVETPTLAHTPKTTELHQDMTDQDIFAAGKWFHINTIRELYSSFRGLGEICNHIRSSYNEPNYFQWKLDVQTRLYPCVVYPEISVVDDADGPLCVYEMTLLMNYNDVIIQVGFLKISRKKRSGALFLHLFFNTMRLVNNIDNWYEIHTPHVRVSGLLTYALYNIVRSITRNDTNLSRTIFGLNAENVDPTVVGHMVRTLSGQAALETYYKSLGFKEHVRKKKKVHKGIEMRTNVEHFLECTEKVIVHSEFTFTVDVSDAEKKST